MKKFNPGDPQKLYANDWNTLVDAAEWVKERQRNKLSESTKLPDQSGIVLIQNKSGAAMTHLNILAIDTISITPTNNENFFQCNTPIFDCIAWASVPDAEKYRRQFVILQEPIDINKCGKAMVYGITPCRLNVINANHTYAKPSTTDNEKLDTSYAGPCRILWKESGTGTKWGVVQFATIPWTNWLPTTPYTIDRSLTADDAKEWDPSQDKPTDWKDYDGVKLIYVTLRYVSGTGASLKYVKHTLQWLTPFAPVIAAAVVTTATTSTC
jgi:hypothetical protein